MAADYAALDWAVANYQIYGLDQQVVDPETNAPLLLRGPQPENLATGGYLACIGAAQTFGRFCEQPFPVLLGKQLGLPTLNLGRGSAGPIFFHRSGDKLLQFINRARLVVVQIMSGRSASNSLYESRGIGHYRKRSDGSTLGCDEAFQNLLANHPRGYVKQIVAETRQNWVEEYVKLLKRIQPPKILFWFSTRQPLYREDYSSLAGLYGEFPQLVCPWMIEALKAYADGYVECVSKKGLPHDLVSRHSGKPVVITDPWGGEWRQNWYYPSPEMHVLAAKMLEKVCRPLLVTSRLEENAGSAKVGINKSLNLARFPFRLVNRAQVLLGGHKQYRKFIILGRGRSGSNFLRGLLNSHSQLLVFGEIFRFYDSIGWEFPEYDQLFQSRHLISMMQVRPEEFVERQVFKKFPKAIAAVGFKLFYYHAQEDSRKSLWPFLKSKKDLRIIHLKRNNALKVLLSEKRAFETNRWTNTTGVSEKKYSTALEYDECLTTFRRNEEEKISFDSYFADHLKLDVFYENLVADCSGEMGRVQEFLGVPREVVKPATFQQSNQPLSESITNYHELKTRFAGTSWAGFFED